MNLRRKRGLAGVSVLAIVYVIPWATIRAQTLSTPAPQAETQSSSDPGWHVGITPYVWFAGVHGTAGVLDHDVSVHASFGDIFNYLNIGAMGVVDLRYDRVVMPGDFLWMKLSDNHGLPLNEAGVNSIKAKM